MDAGWFKVQSSGIVFLKCDALWRKCLNCESEGRVRWSSSILEDKNFPRTRALLTSCVVFVFRYCRRVYPFQEPTYISSTEAARRPATCRPSWFSWRRTTCPKSWRSCACASSSRDWCSSECSRLIQTCGIDSRGTDGMRTIRRSTALWRRTVRWAAAARFVSY